MRKSAPILLLLLSSLAATAARAGENVLVVMSSELAPYQEALAGIRTELGANVPVVALSKETGELPLNGQVVIAIGGKAAIHPYPEGTRLIYCLAPGLALAKKGKAAGIRVEVSPTLLSMTRRFKSIQPSLKRLGVLWTSDSMKAYLDEADAIRAELGVEIVTYRLAGTDELPETLRRLQGKVDALWLPPDPPLISAASLSTIKGFSWANDVPFYVPSDGLTASGALASVSSSFRDMGRTAAKAARTLIEGRLPAATIFPDITKTTFNLSAAKELNVQVDQGLIGTGDQVLP